MHKTRSVPDRAVFAVKPRSAWAKSACRARPRHRFGSPDRQMRSLRSTRPGASEEASANAGSCQFWFNSGNRLSPMSRRRQRLDGSPRKIWRRRERFPHPTSPPPRLVARITIQVPSNIGSDSAPTRTSGFSAQASPDCCRKQGRIFL